jgi:hypothetical protein
MILVQDKGARQNSFAHCIASCSCVGAQIHAHIVYGVVMDTLSKVAVARAVVLPLVTAKPTYTF